MDHKLCSIKLSYYKMIKRPPAEFSNWKAVQEKRIKELNKLKEVEDKANDPLDEKVKELQEKLRNISKVSGSSFSSSQSSTMKRLEREKDAVLRNINVSFLSLSWSQNDFVSDCFLSWSGRQEYECQKAKDKNKVRKIKIFSYKRLFKQPKRRRRWRRMIQLFDKLTFFISIFRK